MRVQLRGISPVIATVIILAVTIAIAVAVIGWITGLFGATTGGTEQLQIMPDSYINATNNVVYIHLVNKGSDVSIYKVEVSGVCTYSGDGKSEYNVSKTIPSSISWTPWSSGVITIKAGADEWLLLNKTNTRCPYVAGTSYTVKVYTKNGNVFTATLTASSG